MAQHTNGFDIPNQSGASFREDLNEALEAIVTKNSGSSAPPSPTYAYEEWLDTDATPPTLYLRDSSSSSTWHIAAQYQTIGAGGFGDPWGFTDRKLYYRLNAPYVGSNVNTAQSLFGVGVSLAAGTIYEFSMVFCLSKTAGTISHLIGLGFGGTATINNISYATTGIFTTSAFPSVFAPDVFNYCQTTSNTSMTSALASAATNLRMIVTGTVSVNAAGTFIPQYTLSAAPGGAYSTTAGSHIRMMPLGSAGVINIGNWS